MLGEARAWSRGRTGEHAQRPSCPTRHATGVMLLSAGAGTARSGTRCPQPGSSTGRAVALGRALAVAALELSTAPASPSTSANGVKPESRKALSKVDELRCARVRATVANDRALAFVAPPLGGHPGFCCGAWANTRGKTARARARVRACVGTGADAGLLTLSSTWPRRQGRRRSQTGP